MGLTHFPVISDKRKKLPFITTNYKYVKKGLFNPKGRMIKRINFSDRKKWRLCLWVKNKQP